MPDHSNDPRLEAYRKARSIENIRDNLSDSAYWRRRRLGRSEADAAMAGAAVRDRLARRDRPVGAQEGFTEREKLEMQMDLKRLQAELQAKVAGVMGDLSKSEDERRGDLVILAKQHLIELGRIDEATIKGATEMGKARVAATGDVLANQYGKTRAEFGAAANLTAGSAAYSQWRGLPENAGVPAESSAGTPGYHQPETFNSAANFIMSQDRGDGSQYDAAAQWASEVTHGGTVQELAALLRGEQSTTKPQLNARFQAIRTHLGDDVAFGLANNLELAESEADRLGDLKAKVKEREDAITNAALDSIMAQQSGGNALRSDWHKKTYEDLMDAIMGGSSDEIAAALQTPDTSGMEAMIANLPTQREGITSSFDIKERIMESPKFQQDFAASPMEDPEEFFRQQIKEITKRAHQKTFTELSDKVTPTFMKPKDRINHMAEAVVNRQQAPLPGQEHNE
jgi:hypothetical protein